MAPRVPNRFLRRRSHGGSGEGRTRLLEINLISAQQIKNVVGSLRAMQTYAITYISQEKKLRTRVDRVGRENPTWNDKFIFRVPEAFLSDENSAVSVEIYAVGIVFDALVGTVRVLVSNLLSVGTDGGAGFAALQIRRPSGRFHGVLNVGMIVLEDTAGSLTWRSDVALGYRDLMGRSLPRLSSARRSSAALTDWNGCLTESEAEDGDVDNNGGKKIDECGLKTKMNSEKELANASHNGDCNGDGEGGPGLTSATGTSALCGLVFQKKNFGDSKINPSASDQNLQQKSVKIDYQ
ncbi:hypothetical protein EJ110_NYTH10768 [Nymphaea thermarum]|nr:hypothetical protein EJ110_NYTH10768 [Nymphaea thermarum]